ncbi:hypothetical protein WA588_002331 [Blastocystis sp. NMH]
MSSSRADLELITTTLRDLKRLVSGNEGGPSKKVKLSPAVWDNGEKISWARLFNLGSSVPRLLLEDGIMESESVHSMELVPMFSSLPSVNASPELHSVPVAESELHSVPVAESELHSVPVAESELHSVPVAESELHSVPVAESELHSVPVAESELHSVPVAESELHSVPKAFSPVHLPSPSIPIINSPLLNPPPSSQSPTSIPPIVTSPHTDPTESSPITTSHPPTSPTSREQQLQRILDQMQLPPSPLRAAFKPPQRLAPPPAIHHLVFVYLDHRGCADRIRLLISLVAARRLSPPLSAATLSLPELTNYARDRALPPLAVPVLEIHAAAQTQLLLHDEPIFAFLLQTYRLDPAPLPLRLRALNVEASCQFVLRELWWLQHASHADPSDAARMKRKKQFIASVLFPSLQLIDAEFQRLRREAPDQVFGCDLALLSLLSALDDSFDVIVDLFAGMKRRVGGRG